MTLTITGTGENVPRLWQRRGAGEDEQRRRDAETAATIARTLAAVDRLRGVCEQLNEQVSALLPPGHGEGGRA